MKIENLSFPVLSVSGNLMLSAKTGEQLARGTRKAVSQGYFDEVVVTDSEGRRVRLGGARPVANRHPGVMLAWFLGFPVALTFDSIRPASRVGLDEFKEEVKKQLNKDRQFWSSVGIGYAGLRDAVNAATSFQEIILMFA